MHLLVRQLASIQEKTGGEQQPQKDQRSYSKLNCGNLESNLRAQKSSLRRESFFCKHAKRCAVEVLSWCRPYLGGAGVNDSRLRPGSTLGLGLGAFLGSFLPLSLLPMLANMTQKAASSKVFREKSPHATKLRAPNVKSNANSIPTRVIAQQPSSARVLGPPQRKLDPSSPAVHWLAEGQ